MELQEEFLARFLDGDEYTYRRVWGYPLGKNWYTYAIEPDNWLITHRVGGGYVGDGYPTVEMTKKAFRGVELLGGDEHSDPEKCIAAMGAEVDDIAFSDGFRRSIHHVINMCTDDVAYGKIRRKSVPMSMVRYRFDNV